MLRLIAALDPPTAGQIAVFGQDLAQLARPAGFRRTQVGLVFQLHNLLPQLSAQQNVEIAMFGVQRDRHARQPPRPIGSTSRPEIDHHAVSTPYDAV